MTGTVIGQLIPILASPFLTRLYSGEQFGVFALYMSISSFFSLLASARYDVAIVLPAEQKKAVNLLGLSLLIAVIITIVSFLMMEICSTGFSLWFNEPRLTFYLKLVPLSVISMGVYQALSNWALREKKFRTISASRIIQSVFTVVVSLILAFTSEFYHGLIFGFIAGQIAGAIFISFAVLSSNPVEWSAINRGEMKSVAKEYESFPRVNTAHVMLDGFQNNGITFLISLLFGNLVLGWYSLSYRILRAPLAFIGAAFSQVLYQQMSEMKNQGITLRPIVIQNLKKITLIGLPFFFMIILFAPVLFKIFFGTDWEKAGVLAQLMSPWLFLNFLTSPVSQIPNILNRQSKSLLINLAGVLAAFSVLWAAAKIFSSYEIPILLFSLASLIYFSILLFWIIKISDFKIKN